LRLPAAGTRIAFLSYDSRSRDAVMAIAEALREREVPVFLDRFALRPGLPWGPELEAALRTCTSVAAFLGPHPMGNWQQREVFMALDRQTKEPEFPVVPVLLPGAGSDPPLSFLRLNTWVDLRSGLHDAVLLNTLAGALLGKPTGVTRQEICPFRGLLPFREEDAPFFFGREAFAARLVEAVASHQVVAVLGASGSGKSSVVQAGLLPRLRSGSGTKTWEIVIIRPTDQPFDALAAGLAPLLGEEPALATALATGDETTRSATLRVLARQPGTDRLLLVVDQWEELYTLCRNDEVRKRFVDGLLEAATPGGPMSLVLTLRADFFGQVLSHRHLAERLQNAMVNIGPMTRQELAQAMELPAERVGLRFEPGLSDRVLDDVTDEPGNLPLLEFVLAQLWEQRRGSELTHEVYDRMGEAQGAIARRGDMELETLTEAERGIARRVLLQLVRPGEGTGDTRRRATFGDLGDAAVPIVRRLAGARLLVTGRDSATGEETVEIAHETLIRNWTQLQKWVAEVRQFLLWRERLRLATDDWRRLKRHPGALLRGPQLAEAVRWRRAQGGELGRLDHEFIGASRRREWTRRLRVAGGVSLLFLVAAVLVYVFSGREWAGEVLAAADRATDPLVGTLLIAELTGEGEPKGGAAVARRLANAIVPTAVLRGHAGSIAAAAFSRDGSQVVTGSKDSTARVWRADGRGDPIVLQGHQGAVHTARFSPDGSQIVTASADGTARLWPVGETAGGPVLSGHGGEVLSAAFSQDGSKIVTASQDGTARVWSADGDDVVVLRGHEGTVHTAVFDSPGLRVVTASEDSTARVWRADGTGEPIVLGGHLDAVMSAAFNFDGGRVVTASRDGMARVWQAGGAGDTVVLRGHTGAVWNASFSRDGVHVITTSDDGTVRVWRADGSGQAVVHRSAWMAAFSLDGSRLVVAFRDSTARVRAVDDTTDFIVLRHSAPVWHADFSPDGSRVVTASSTGVAWVWPLAGAGDPIVLSGHGAEVWSAAFDGAGSRVVTASDDSTARIWGADGKGPARVLRGHRGPVLSAQFDTAGTRVVTGSLDGTARIWRTDGSSAPVVLSGHNAGAVRAAFSPDGSRVVSWSDDGTARVSWSDGRGTPVVLRGHSDYVSTAAFSPDGARVVTASGDRTARVWPVAGSDAGPPLVLAGHGAEVSVAAFRQDGARIVTASEDGTARVWRTDHPSQPVVLQGRHGPVRRAAFSPDGSRVVTASSDGSIQVWQADGTGEPVTLRGPVGGVLGAAFSPNGAMVGAAFADGTARLWRADGQGEPLVLRGHAGGVRTVGFNRDGTRVVTASVDGTARVWRVGWFGLLQHLRRSTTACLTPDQRRQLLPSRDRFPGSRSEQRQSYESCERRYHRTPRF
jgi:WD40 repeat protein